jgi:hypothetical protein
MNSEALPDVLAMSVTSKRQAQKGHHQSHKITLPLPRGSVKRLDPGAKWGQAQNDQNLHGVKTQNNIVILTAVRTSNLTKYMLLVPFLHRSLQFIFTLRSKVNTKYMS